MKGSFPASCWVVVPALCRDGGPDACPGVPGPAGAGTHSGAVLAIRQPAEMVA